jgi:hypothetical protein
MPKPQEYIDMLKAAPTWITGPKADQLLLVAPGGPGGGGRIALNANGQPISVPFSMPAIQPREQPMPSQVGP